jgi:hypothetical protein
VFQVHGVDADGVAVLRQRLTRSRLLQQAPSRPAKPLLTRSRNLCPASKTAGQFPLVSGQTYWW